MRADATTLRLEGRRALVTGAASGIGLAVARRLCDEGARTVMVDVRGNVLADVCRCFGDQARAATCDVTHEPGVQAAVSGALAWLGGLDIVVTSAGITRAGATHDLPLEVWETVLRVNLTGTFLVLKHCIPALRLSGRGAIVTIGSVASVVAAGRTAAYDAAKGGVLQLTRAVAVENVDFGLRANCVLPGIVSTPLASNSAALHGVTSADDSISPASRLRVPMARTADPAEIAAVVAFLASDDASFVTGAALSADGGYTAI